MLDINPNSEQCNKVCNLRRETGVCPLQDIAQKLAWLEDSIENKPVLDKDIKKENEGGERCG